LHFETHLIYLITFDVESEAVGKHKFHICYEFFQRLVPIVLKVTFDGAKVHRMLDYAKII
jgi:hypothetical protein